MVERLYELVFDGPGREDSVYEDVRDKDCDRILPDAEGLWAEGIELLP